MVDRKRYDIAASEDNPLDYATARCDSDVLSYLRTALEEKNCAFGLSTDRGKPRITGCGVLPRINSHS